MENQILITLKNNKLFRNILMDEIDFSNINGSLVSIHEGEILFREKAKSNLLYLVVSGEINLLTKQADSKAQSLIFTDNDFLGCEEFLADIPRKSTAVALRDSYLIALTKEEVDSLVNQNYDILNNIYASIPESETSTDENKIEEPIFKEQSDINEPLPTSIPEETTDANFFDEVDKLDENEIEETIFKEQSDINKPLSTSIPKETTDANFFDEVDNSDENEIEIEEPIFKEQSDDNESLPTPSVSEVPPTTTDANFFDEVESDDDIFGDAQKDLDNYSAPAFPDFEEEKDEAEKNKKTDEGGSFFDDI